MADKGLADALNLRPAAEFSFGADLTGDARHFRVEGAEPRDRRLDGLARAEEIVFQRAAVDFEVEILRQIAFGDRANEGVQRRPPFEIKFETGKNPISGHFRPRFHKRKLTARCTRRKGIGKPFRSAIGEQLAPREKRLNPAMRKELWSLLGGLFSPGKDSLKKLENRVVEIGGEAYDYQIHVPESGEAPLPVIVFLHGIGQRGAGGFVPQNGPVGALVHHYLGQMPAIVVLPQCRPGKYWSDSAMEQMVMKALRQTVEEFGADRRRVYLIGVSMGGFGVWHFAARYPEVFAALVPICGGSPVLRGERFSLVAGKVNKIPAWVFHGADDPVVPVSESRQMVRAIEAAGGAVKYTEYPQVGHHVWVNALREKELLPWLLRQKN